MKREYIIPFSWEDYRIGDRLIYRGLVHEYDSETLGTIYYGISLSDWILYEPLNTVIAVMTDYQKICCSRGEISLSEIKIDRTPGIWVQLYHYIIDLWKTF